MRAVAKSGLAAALALTLVATASVKPAEAGRGGDVAAGIIGGIIVGGIIAGAAANARPRYYRADPVGCVDYRRRAMGYEDAGRPDKARFWWDSYYSCRGY